MRIKSFLFSLVFIGTSIFEGYGQSASNNIELLYSNAIVDAMVADSSEICDTLWNISPGNPKLELRTIGDETYVRLACFTRFPNSFKDSVVVNSWGEFWVFIPQQFDTRMKQVLTKDTDTLLRIRQILGLPPDNKNTFIAEMWINVNDLFRPAGDPNIGERSTSPFLPKDVSDEYRQWFLSNVYNTYFSEYTHFPWTRLGYTYDWAADACEVGLSEFCVRKNSKLYPIGVSPASKYIK